VIDLCSHPERQKLLEHVKDVGVEVLGEEERLQRRAVLLHLLVVLEEKGHKLWISCGILIENTRSP
jgi:hypothetical protein